MKGTAEMNSHHYVEQKSCALRHVLSNSLEVRHSQSRTDVMPIFFSCILENEGNIDWVVLLEFLNHNGVSSMIAILCSVVNSFLLLRVMQLLP